MLPVPVSHRQKLADLKALLATERKNLKELDAALAEEQAAVNGFRMHCRLKIGDLLDMVYELRSEKQALMTRIEMIKQAMEKGVAPEELEAFWQQDEEEVEEPIEAGVPEKMTESADKPDGKSAKKLYRDLARRFHPDRANGSAERAYATSIMAAVNDAYKRKDMQALGDLAGEVDPEVMAEFEGIDTAEFNKLRTSLMRVKRRKRRIGRQLKVLRKENTAQLWREAQSLDVEGRVWWDEVAHAFSSEISTLETEKATLTETLSSLRDAFSND